jgi:hypothetical protein
VSNFSATSWRGQITFQWDENTLYQNNMLSWIFITHWNNSLQVDMLLHSDILYQFLAQWSLFLLLDAACLAANTNFIVFDLPRLGLESTIYHSWGRHANLYTTDAVCSLQSTPLEVSMLTFTPLMQFVLYNLPLLRWAC